MLTRILSTLPPKFNHFHSAWDSTTDTKRTVENLTARLLTEELRVQKRDETEETTVALVSKLNLQTNSKNHVSSEKKAYPRKERGKTAVLHAVKRAICARTTKAVSSVARDHIVKYCPKEKTFKMNEGESSNKPAQAFMGHTSHTGTKEDWIIDSGASDHITNRRDWFFEYQ